MQSFMLTIARGLGTVATLALWLAGTGLVLMTVFVAWQVFGRFVLNDSPTWTESLSTIIMGWFVFLGAAVGIREGYHLSFDVLIHVLPQRAKLWLFTVSDLVVAGFGAGMFWFGWQLAAGTWDSTLPNVGLPTGVTYLALVFSGALMVIFSAERVARRLAGLPTARFGDPEPEDDPVPGATRAEV